MPLFCEPWTRIEPPYTIEKLMKLERIPCASMLLRVDKAPRDLNGVPMSYENTDTSMRFDSGVVNVAPKYRKGIYNNSLNPIDNTEKEILKYKNKRTNPDMKTAMIMFKDLLKVKKKMNSLIIVLNAKNYWSKMKKPRKNSNKWGRPTKS